MHEHIVAHQCPMNSLDLLYYLSFTRIYVLSLQLALNLRFNCFKSRRGQVDCNSKQALNQCLHIVIILM